MPKEKLINILDSLLAMPAENEIVEFKKAQSNFDDDKLGLVDYLNAF